MSDSFAASATGNFLPLPLILSLAHLEMAAQEDASYIVHK